MDRDQHRQKRSRLQSTERTNDICSQRDGAPDDDSKQENVTSRARLSATTMALQKISLQGKQRPGHSTDLQHSGINPALCLLNQLHNSTPPTSFLAHPSVHQNGTPSASISFNPIKTQNKLHHYPISPNVRKNKATPSHDIHEEKAGSSDLKNSSKEPQLSSQSAGLPLYGPRPIQPFRAILLRPSSKQVERGEQNSSPQHPKTFQGKPIRPQPIHVSASEKDTTSNPFASSTSNFSIRMPAVAHMLPETQTQLSESHNSRFQAGISSIICDKRSYQLLGDSSTASTFPYPSIYPAKPTPAQK